jgi:hypothetical protein
VVYTRVIERGDARDVRWRDLGAGLGTVRWSRQVAVAFRSRSELVRWFALNGGSAPLRVPPVDFRRRTLLLSTVGPRSSTGYGIEVVRVTERRSRIDVLLGERTPDLHDRVSARLTFPYRLISIPATTKAIHFGYEGRP